MLNIEYIIHLMSSMFTYNNARGVHAASNITPLTHKIHLFALTLKQIFNTVLF